MVAVLKAPPPNFNPRYKREWFEDLAVTFAGRTEYFSVEAEWVRDESGGVIVGTVYYDGKPISALPAIVSLIEQAVQEEVDSEARNVREVAHGY
jgi:hypothetical protein